MKPDDINQNWHDQKTYESLISHGINGIKYVLLTNGGAILSIMTFIGNKSDKAPNLITPIVLFCVGILFGGLTSITSYCTQLALFNEKTSCVPLYRNHQLWLWTSVFFIFIGNIFFFLGAILAVTALSS